VQIFDHSQYVESFVDNIICNYMWSKAEREFGRWYEKVKKLQKEWRTVVRHSRRDGMLLQ